MHSRCYKANANDSPVTAKTDQTAALFNALKGIKHMQSVRITRATSAALLLTTAFAWNLPAVAQTAPTQAPARAAVMDGKAPPATSAASAAKGAVAGAAPGASAPAAAPSMQESHMQAPAAVFGGGKPAASQAAPAAKGGAAK